MYMYPMERDIDEHMMRLLSSTDEETDTWLFLHVAECVQRGPLLQGGYKGI